jgi:hypothetical protein
MDKKHLKELIELIKEGMNILEDAGMKNDAAHINLQLIDILFSIEKDTPKADSAGGIVRMPNGL